MGGNLSLLWTVFPFLCTDIVLPIQCMMCVCREDNANIYPLNLIISCIEVKLWPLVKIWPTPCYLAQCIIQQMYRNTTNSRMLC